MSKYVRPPFNYTGGKFKLLEDLFRCFPKNINTLYDVFGGGFSVGLNSEALKVVYNEQLAPVAGCIKYMYNTPTQQFIDEVLAVCDRYNLKDGGEAAYLYMRSKYLVEYADHAMFFALLSHSFNSLVRFNSEGGFNAHYGGSHNTLRASRIETLRTFLDKLHSIKLQVLCGSFIDVPVADVESNFVYCDPPYLITKCDYNSGWRLANEYALYHWLDTLNNRGVKFGVSNVLRSSGRYNHILAEWSRKYQVHKFNMKYTNSSPVRKNRHERDEEVFVCNYDTKIQ